MAAAMSSDWNPWEGPGWFWFIFWCVIVFLFLRAAL
jgi:hypothetical protein